MREICLCSVRIIEKPTDESRTFRAGLDQVISRIAKNGRETVFVRLTRYQQVDLVDIRSFVAGKDDELVPTSKGIAIKVEKLPELIEGLTAALAEAKAQGLIDVPMTGAERARKYRARRRHAARHAEAQT